jgi:cation:H+ antiporter
MSGCDIRIPAAHHGRMTILAIIGGFVLLCVGAELLIRGAVALALRIGLSPLVVGLTVVAFGTSSPEIVVGIKAALDGNGGIAVGSVIGSNICNIGLILSFGILVRPIKVHVKLLRRDIPILVLVTALVPLTLIGGVISRTEGAVLLGTLVAYILFNIYGSSHEEDPEAKHEFEDELVHPSFRLAVTLLQLIGGIGGLALGGRLLLFGGVGLASDLGVSETVIGLTVVAFGTSLPELATTIAAARRGHGDIAVGNAIGSNMMNLLAVLGLSALVRPLTFSGVNLFEIGVLIAFTALLLPLMFSDFTLKRAEGALLLAGYIGFILITVLG